MFCAINF